MDTAYKDIPGYPDWKSVTLLEKGWSSDKKYIVVTQTGEKLLLRLASAEAFDRKKKEYGIVCKYAAWGIPMSRPLDFGRCGNGTCVYMLLTWVEGDDLEAVLPTLSEADQYRLGVQAGQILKRIHQIPVEPGDLPNQTKAEKKRNQLNRYLQSQVRVPDDEAAVRYLFQHLDDIWQEPPLGKRLPPLRRLPQNRPKLVLGVLHLRRFSSLPAVESLRVVPIFDFFFTNPQNRFKIKSIYSGRDHHVIHCFHRRLLQSAGPPAEGTGYPGAALQLCAGRGAGYLRRGHRRLRHPRLL